MHPSKRKGSRFEHDTVKQIKSFGFEAERAISSDGRTKGWDKSVDLEFDTFKCQLKRRDKLPEYLAFTEHTNMVILREDRGEALALLKLEDLLAILRSHQLLSARLEATNRPRLPRISDI